MAYEIPGFSFTVPAGADFSAGAQFRFAALSNTATLVNPTLGGPVIGVRYTRSKLGEAATVVQTGIAIVEASAAIAIGAYVSSTALGLAKTAAASEVIAGIAMEAATGAGIQIAVLLTSPAKA